MGRFMGTYFCIDSLKLLYDKTLAGIAYGRLALFSFLSHAALFSLGR